MIEEPVVILSDSPSRYATRFTVEALMGALYDGTEVGLPFLLNHDEARPLGWILPTSLHLQSGKAHLIGRILIPEIESDVQKIKAVKSEYLRRLAQEHQDHIAELRRVVEASHNGGGRLIIKDSVALVEDGLARRVAPHLFQEVDRDGLIAIDRLDAIGPGVFRVGECLVYAHPSLRRSSVRLNSLNKPFLSRLQSVAATEIDARIRLDPDMVGLASSYGEHFEYAYWWGPRFDDRLASIVPGVTRHEASDHERTVHGISRTEFWWHRQDNRPTLEIEEVRDIPSLVDAGELYACRYAHAIVDEDSGRVVHFDGAIRAYAEDLMVERLDSSIDRFGRRSEYSKLWRIDAPVPVTLWKELLSDYFRDNSLVGEYLGADEDPRTAGGPAIANYDDESGPQVIPYSIESGVGLQVAISIWPVTSEVPAVRYVRPLDTLSRGEEHIAYVGSETVELRKALRRREGDLYLPDSTGIVARKDRYKALPLIAHSPEASSEDIELTYAAHLDLVHVWNERGFDIVTSINLAFVIEDQEVRLAVLGHCQEVERWLRSPLSRPPATISEFGVWATQVQSFLAEHSSPPPASFSFLNVLMLSGVFVLPHLVIDMQEFEVETTVDEGGLYFQLSVPDTRPEIQQALSDEGLTAVMLYSVERSTCSTCGGEYMICEHSKMLDDGVYQTIEETGIAALIWTDRPVT